MHVRHWSVLVLHKYFRHPSHATCLEKRDYGSAVGLYLCEGCLGEHPALSLRVLLLEVLQLLAGRRHPLELREIAEASVMKMQFM